MVPSERPLLIDLFCGAGGAAMGYYRAGFDVIGVDFKPQPRYPFAFVQGDVFEVWDSLPHERAWGYHASPPCQAYLLQANQWRKEGRDYPDLIGSVRQLLVHADKPFVIENVPGAPLKNPTLLNGAMFGMLIHRLRLFETRPILPFILLPQLPRPVEMGRPVSEGDVLQPVGHFSGVDYARREMGIPWMTGAELSQAIPPAYTEWIGRQLLERSKSCVTN